MSTKLKLYVGRKIIDALDKATKFSPTQLQNLIHVGNPVEKSKVELNLPMNILETHLGITNVNHILKIQPDDIIRSVNLVRDRANRKISFEIDRTIFMKDVMENSFLPDLNFKPRNMVIEFSSPNVAKPFHYGHLRSTIIGNFLSNLNTFIKNKVTRLNYLGDWGTQFGLIKIGVDHLNYDTETLKNDPIKLLYQSYVHANKLAESDPNIAEQAKALFARLEQGSPEDLEAWRQILDFTKDELAKTYSRLGITFDEYNYESMYSAKEISSVIEALRTKNILKKQKDGKEVAEIGNDRTVSVMKSDGTTLYLTRDIAAAIDRFEKFKFDKMYYVVENGQSDHFNALKSIVSKMDKPWADRIFHVKFGRIRGMSTRKGTAVFLNDILDECKELVVKKQIESPTTKVPITDEKTSDILGISCVIINDLKQRRQKDYDFDWDTILQVKGDTGIKLQYTHCRLTSLEENAGAIPATVCNSEILKEEEVTILLKQMAKFQDVLHIANEQLEASVLVTYLFHLCNRCSNHISKALKRLQVKGMDPEVASQRLLLFNTAREVLKNGMTILGLTPLKKM
ncbi:probable arginine--tRNA ligase, mitochondrial isoform X1 [Dendroctonus ponderosae]|uniref:probable arginine--tRNA ligase, mitochondrial isoform X1 n=1 Tax=Dendroctonus ponderosae TaxID=77166 RepID=UPI002034AF8A|nr:probable arginine--tRNA ligase, mitochondrial isoform X1 [Dendroctonus ponderosae]